MKSISFQNVTRVFTFVGVISALAQPKPALADAISANIFNNTLFNQTSPGAPVTPPFYFFNIGANFQTPGSYNAATATYPGPGSPQSLTLTGPTVFDFGSILFS